jgi:hypothetical protein
LLRPSGKCNFRWRLFSIGVAEPFRNHIPILLF